MSLLLPTDNPPPAIRHYEQEIAGAPCYYKRGLETLVQASRDGDTIILCGLHEGRALVYLGVEIVHSRKAIQLIGNDVMDKVQVSGILGVIRPLAEIGHYSIRIAPEKPEDFAAQLDRRFIDAVWMEGLANETLMRRRIRAWLPVLKIGGLLGISNVNLPEVTTAYAEVSSHFALMSLDQGDDGDTPWNLFQRVV